MIDVARRHQVAIAKKTLHLSTVGAMIMGGMDHPTAREVLAVAGWSPTRISRYERVVTGFKLAPKRA